MYAIEMSKGILYTLMLVVWRQQLVACYIYVQHISLSAAPASSSYGSQCISCYLLPSV